MKRFHRKACLVGFVMCLSLKTLASGGEALCYVPGAGGGSDYAFFKLPGLMEKRGITFFAFDVNKNGSIQQKAARLQAHIQKQIDANPDFRCDWVAFSQGGIVARYALNHLTIKHPTMGEVLMKDITLTLSTMATPHRGTPLARIGSGIIGGRLDEGMRQLSEAGLELFNDPQHTETYSPAIEGMPTFSYRSFMNSNKEAQGLGEKLGYSAIKSDRNKHGLDITNDGIVPTDSQDWEKLVATFNVPHSFWSESGPFSMTLPDFMETHLKMLKGALLFEAVQIERSFFALPTLAQPAF